MASVVGYESVMETNKKPRMEAAQRGETKFHGRPCRRCGSTERYVCSSNCIACHKSVSNVYHSKVREARKQAEAASQ